MDGDRQVGVIDTHVIPKELGGTRGGVVVCTWSCGQSPDEKINNLIMWIMTHNILELHTTRGHLYFLSTLQLGTITIVITISQKIINIMSISKTKAITINNNNNNNNINYYYNNNNNMAIIILVTIQWC